MANPNKLENRPPKMLLYKLNTCGAGKKFLFNKIEIMGKYSLGIDTAFATMSDTSTHNLGVLVPANTYIYTYICTI